ncbi:MAG: gliding motility-associated C-terminal domain-containing protein, partial [Bacteroidota bacterium]
GIYWVEITKINANAGPPAEGAVGCTSAPYQFEIIDRSVDPTYTFTVTANTSCDPAGADGTATITPDDNGTTIPLTTWTYSFVSGPTDFGVETNANASHQFTNLLPGDYTFTLSYDSSGCATTGAFSIPDNQIPPLLLDPDYNIVHQLYCIVGGSITINNVNTIESITLNTIVDNTLSNYEFTWYYGEDFNTADSLYTDIGFSATAGETYDINDPGFSGAGTYWLEVKKINTNPGEGGLGCTSTPYQFVIEDQSVDPIITFDQTSNTACNSDVNGTITAYATTSGVPVPSPTSIFTWYVGNDISTPWVDGTFPGDTIDQSVAGQETLVNVAPGDYTVTVQDGTTGCSFTASFTVDDQPAIPTLTLDNATVLDQDICNPSGSITINDSDITLFDPNTGANIPVTTADFEFLWYRGSPDTSPLQDDLGSPIIGPALLTGTGAGEYSAMGADTYYVQLVPVNVGIGLGAGCYGPPVSKIVLDISTDPILSFATTVNSSCDELKPNGSISVTAEEFDGSTVGPYTYSWALDGTPLALPDTTTVINPALDGGYSVTVTNIATGCSYTEGHTLILDLSISEPNIIDVATVDPLDCNPTGQIEVLSVQVGGQPALLADFVFEWYDTDPDVGIQLVDPIPATIPILENLDPGTYYVIARDIITNCISIPKEVNILPDDIIIPDVLINLNRPQSSCDVETPNGSLSATVDGGNDDTNPNYLFTWYHGPTVNPDSLIANGNSSTLTDAASGEYLVDVYDNTTNCSNTDIYFIEDAQEELRLQISVSEQPVTFCNILNGVLEARVTNHPDVDTANFVFHWEDQHGNTYIGSHIDNLAIGPYTVYAEDTSGNYCPSLIASGDVRDNRVIPEIILTEDNPLTNCFVDQPNGQLTASVNGVVGGYDFEWYTGTDTTGTAIHDEYRLSELTTGTYTVVVTDQLTHCINIASGEITDGTVTPPTPTATVLHHQEMCIPPYDGEVTADVNGDVLDHTFDWYNGSTVGSTPDGTDYDHINLEAGDYTVTATDIKTGCISDPETVTVLDQRVYPEFEYNIVPANCEATNGSIELVFLDAYEIQTVSWFDPTTGAEIDRATNLYQYPSGDYEVTVTTFYGCETDGAATIHTEITNYNGISANGDGQNDDFQIDCITLFPNNNVKIFNRAGILVYEADFYNNDEIVFRGVGENGLYLIGEDLPDGTYFYIIDKGDGSRPKTGYLELMR